MEYREYVVEQCNPYLNKLTAYMEISQAACPQLTA